jgi:hypothetical protein
LIIPNWGGPLHLTSLSTRDNVLLPKNEANYG